MALRNIWSLAATVTILVMVPGRVLSTLASIDNVIAESANSSRSVAEASRSASCGQPSERIPAESDGEPVGKRVVGGSATTTRSFPWTVMIKRYGHSDVVCTGAILTTRLVLTAAHCFDNVHQSNLYLWVGKDQMDYANINQQLHLVERVAIHHTYNRSNKMNDIAILQTANDMGFNSNVRPICLPDAHTQLPPTVHCVLAGYGDTLGTGFERRLNYIEVPIVDDSLCGQDDWLGADFQAVQGVSFCAGYGDGGPNACSGDSGAALVCPHPTDHYYYVYGVSSWGRGCGERRKPGVYTRVPVFLDWITSILNAPLRH